MQRNYLVFLALLFSFFGFGQIAQYSFLQSQSTYQELSSNKTVLATATANTIVGSFDTANWNVNLPFNFVFGTSTVNSCNINSNGYLVFGATTSSGNTPISASTAYSGAVAVWARDINGAFDASFESSVSWEVLGAAPNRIFVVQYKNVRPVYSTSTTSINLMNFQIRLKETSNVIELVYGPNSAFVGTTASTSTIQIGLRGATNVDFNNRTNATSVNFNASTAGTTNSSTQAFNTVATSTQKMPSNGLTYTFTPPSCLFVGTVNVTNINAPTATVNLTTPSSVPIDVYITSGAEPNGNTVPTVTIPAGQTSVVINNLNVSSLYFVYIKYSCSATGPFFDWKKYTDFITPCDVITGNFYEGFDNIEAGSSTNPVFPHCWSYIDDIVSAGYGYVEKASAQSPRNSYRLYRTNNVANSSQNVALISPETDNLGNGQGVKQVRFSVIPLNSKNGNYLEVFTSDGNTDVATFTVIDTIKVDHVGYKEYAVVFPKTTDDYFGFRLVYSGETASSDINIDDVYYEDAPTCKPIYKKNVIVNKVSKNSIDLSWTDDFNMNVQYEVEVRTSGDPGTPGAVANLITGPGVTVAQVTGLLSSTEYFVFVRAICSSSDNGKWSEVIDFTTLCDYPDFTSYTTSLDLCGPQKAELNAVLADSSAVAAWFDKKDDLTSLYEGPNFVSPNDVTQNRSFWLRSQRISPNTPILIGEGILTTTGNHTFLNHAYGGYKHQFIFTAAELTDKGLTAGPVTALEFDVVTVGTPTRNDFSIAMGTTTQSVATTTHVANANLTQVYSNASETFAVGTKTFTFTTPFVWDGVSNIVVQTNWSNVNSGGSSTGGSGALRYHSSSSSMTTVTYADNKTAADFLSVVTGGVNGSGNTVTVSGRPNTVFVGDAGCVSPAIEIPVTVAPKPLFDLSTDKVSSCDGNASSSVRVVTNLGGYDTFTWSP
ncbi:MULTISPECIES: fibronectin type III domain-containing protein, partial [unclassified Flavobacterium]